MSRKSRKRAKVRRQPQPERPQYSGEELHAMAYRVYVEEGGDGLNLSIKNLESTMRAYASQIEGAETGRKGWGPVVTPYENRMTGSLHAKLLKERTRWLKDARQRIEKELGLIEEEEVHEPEAELQEEAVAVETPVLTETSAPHALHTDEAMAGSNKGGP